MSSNPDSVTWIDEVGCDENGDGVHRCRRCSERPEHGRTHTCGCGAMVIEDRKWTYIGDPPREEIQSDECGRCALEADHFGPCWWPGDPENNDDDT